jgi:hypothetical protein
MLKKFCLAVLVIMSSTSFGTPPSAARAEGKPATQSHVSESKAAQDEHPIGNRAGGSQGHTLKSDGAIQHHKDTSEESGAAQQNGTSESKPAQHHGQGRKPSHNHAQKGKGYTQEGMTAPEAPPPREGDVAPNPDTTQGPGPAQQPSPNTPSTNNNSSQTTRRNAAQAAPAGQPGSPGILCSTDTDCIPGYVCSQTPGNPRGICVEKTESNF